MTTQLPEFLTTESDYINLNLTSNASQNNSLTETIKPHVADAAFNKEIRIIVLYIEVILGAIGGGLVCLWLWANRRRKSRVNKIIFHVAASDLLVIYCACLPQLVWEYDREWRAGEAFCKIIRFVSSFAMMASNYMLVILSIDRYIAIMYPLREPMTVWKMTLCGWVAAAVCSTPQFIIFHVNYVTAKGQFQNMTVCESIFRLHGIGLRQAYLTYVSVVVFYIPFIIIITCYIRIFLKIAGKVSEVKNAPKQQAGRPGKVLLQSSQSSSLSRAKIKILKMTVVIISIFAVCGLPYHILEMWYSYGDHTKVPGVLASILGGMAVANSAVNPYVFLAFNASKNCITGLCPFVKLPRDPRSVYDSGMSGRSDYPGRNSTAMTDIHSRLKVNMGNKDRNSMDGANGQRLAVNLNVKNKAKTYHRVDSEDLHQGY